MRDVSDMFSIWIQGKEYFRTKEEQKIENANRIINEGYDSEDDIKGIIKDLLDLYKELKQDYIDLDKECREEKERNKELEENDEILRTITYQYNVYEVNNKDKIIIADREYFDKGLFVKKFIHKDKIKDLKQLVHETLDGNGITRAFQVMIDEYFNEVLEK